MEQIMYSNEGPQPLMDQSHQVPFSGAPSATDLLGGNTLEGDAAIGGQTGAAEDERAPPSMRPKRVGRKLDTKEPQSKRRAQNRAAQRAFRERKERHLQELEMRIAELEQESATWRNSSMMLRSKVSELENELGQTGRSHAPAQPSPLGPLSRTNRTTQDGLALNSNSTPISHPHIGPSPPHRNSSVDSLFFDGRSDTSGTTPQSSVGGGSTSGRSSAAQAALGGNPTPSEFCDELGLACVVPKAPKNGINTPPPSAHTPGPAAPAAAAQQPIPQLQGPSGGSVLDFSFQQGSSTEPFDVFQFVNNENSMFDPFDFDAVWEDPNQSTLGPDILSLPPGNPERGEYGAFPVPSHSGASHSGASHSGASHSGAPLSGASQEGSTPGSHALSNRSDQTASMHNASSVPSQYGQPPKNSPPAPDIIPATTEKYISCTEVWDRICSRPRFGEIDIRGMCSELRAKAKCSDQGVVLPERELEKFLNSYN